MIISSLSENIYQKQIYILPAVYYNKTLFNYELKHPGKWKYYRYYIVFFITSLVFKIYATLLALIFTYLFKYTELGVSFSSYLNYYVFPFIFPKGLILWLSFAGHFCVEDFPPSFCKHLIQYYLLQQTDSTVLN